MKLNRHHPKFSLALELCCMIPAARSVQKRFLADDLGLVNVSDLSPLIDELQRIHGVRVDSMNRGGYREVAFSFSSRKAGFNVGCSYFETVYPAPKGAML